MDNKTWLDYAREIFYDFKVGQSTTIKGFERVGEEQELVPIGKLVVDELERLDLLENTRDEGGRIRRKRYKPPNTVGGYVAQKIFRYKQETRNSKMIYQIWRLQ